MIGMIRSATSELTIAPNAAPMITPTARSTTLPRIANFLNSSSIVTLRSEKFRASLAGNLIHDKVDPLAAINGQATGIHGDLGPRPESIPGAEDPKACCKAGS